MTWILTGTSESGDDYGPDAFHTKPSELDIREWCHHRDGYFNLGYDSYEDMVAANEGGPGDFGSYVYYTLTEVSEK